MTISFLCGIVTGIGVAALIFVLLDAFDVFGDAPDAK